MPRYAAWWMILALLVGLLSACGGSEAVEDEDIPRGGLGQPCKTDGTCNTGLICTEAVCAFPPLEDGDLDRDEETDTEETPGYECYRDTQCPPNHVCEDHICVELIPDGDDTLDGDSDDDGEAVTEGPVLSLFPPSLNFGSVGVGQRSERELTFQNIGTETVTVESVEVREGTSESGVFALVAPVNRFNLGVGESISITLRFSREAEGEAEALLRIASNSLTGSELTVPLFSTTWGRVSMTLEPDDLDFGASPMNQPANLVVTLTNALLGDDVSDLVIESVAIRQTGSVFSIGSGAPTFPRSLGPGQFAALPLIAVPPSDGQHEASLLIFHNDPAKPYPLVVTMKVLGVAPNLRIDPATFSFGPVAMGDSRTGFITLRNYGGDAVLVNSLHLSESSSRAFTWLLEEGDQPLGTLPARIEVGGFAVLPVVFSPTRFGGHAASLYVGSNDPISGQQVITLTGQAVPPELSIVPGALDFECVQVGQSEVRSITITYSGEGSIGVQSAFVMSNTMFRVTQAPTMPLTLDGQNPSIQIDVAYTPLLADVTDQGILAVVMGDTDTITYEIGLSGCALASVLNLEWDTNNSFRNVQRLPDNMPDIEDMSPAELALWVEREPIGLFNPGNAPLHISEIYSDAATTRIWDVDAIQPLTINPQERGSFDVLYAPRLVTNYTGRFVICSDAINAGVNNPVLCATPGHRPVILEIPRGAIEYDLFVEPISAQVNFGQPLPGEAMTAQVFLRNMRPTTMHIEDISLEGSPAALEAYFIDSVVPAGGPNGWNLAGGPSDVITVNLRFQPPGGGTSSAALAIRHNDKDARKHGEAPGSAFPVFSVILSGNGTDNTPPVAIIKSPPGEPADPLVGARSIAVIPGQVITLDASASYDSDEGDFITAWEWSVVQPNGYTWYGSQTTASAIISFEQAGTYMVNLYVTDSRNAQSAPTLDSRLEVKVQLDPIPVALERTSGQSNVTAFVRTPLLLDGSQSWDPDGQVLSWFWYWKRHDTGDTPTLFSTEINPSITFNQAGQMDVLLHVVDNDGRRSPNPARMDVLVRANDRVKIEALWTNGGNVDLHYIRPGGTFGGAGDCNTANRTPNWGTYGNPEFRNASSTGTQPEVIVHDNPGDGMYTVRAEYITATEDCGYVQDCRWFDKSCDICGCDCWAPLCYINWDICCKSCNECVSTWVCNQRPAAVTFHIYLNGAATPTWTLTGSSYVIPQSPGHVEFNLHRVNGAFMTP